MDIVKSRIENLNGTVDVRSEPGRGTTFTIRLPLTLAIMPVLLVRIGGEAYAIPLDHLDEIVEVRPDAGSTASTASGRSRSAAGSSRCVGARRRLPLGRAPADAGASGSTRPTGSSRSSSSPTARRRSGCVVDELLGMQEAVLKSLEKNFRPVPGLSGASILGDGRVSLILDVDALIEHGHRRRRASAEAGLRTRSDREANAGIDPR